jgi:hypothetical protein
MTAIPLPTPARIEAVQFCDDGLWFTADQMREHEVRVRQEEREACAKVCEARFMGDNNREDLEALRCAESIRARSQK